MRITRVERPSLMKGAAQGELAGIGRWRLFEDSGTTAVLYERMNLLARRLGAQLAAQGKY